jgi:TolB-like protein
MKIKAKYIAALFLLIASMQVVHAVPGNAHYPLAIFDFVEKSRHLSGMGEKVATIVFANLAVNPDISLVDRKEMGKLLDEAELNLSGMVNATQVNQIGQLTGAKIIVTGTIFEIEDRLMLVARIIGTETSRVLGATVKGGVDDSIVDLTEDLSRKIADTISENASSLVAPPIDKHDRIAALREKLHAYKKPSLSININEHHVNQATSDPAAETEMVLYSTEAGFEVIDATGESSKLPNIQISGEGFTEFATKKGNIVSVKARLEVKAVDRVTGKILAVDRQTTTEADLSEMIAGKKALERASALIAERMLPNITTQWNQ